MSSIIASKLENNIMITVEEAQNIIGSLRPNWGTEKVSVSNCTGRVLAEDVLADRDFPPFDRVTMDGIAFSFNSYAQGQREFLVQGTQLAGEPAHELKEPSYALEIMTGAIIANGCDVVVRYEDLEFYEKGGEKMVKVLDESAFQWKNIHKQGSDEKQGQFLLAKGILIDSAIVSILASVGKSEVEVLKTPKVAIISTGDELVEVNEEPLPHQIRKSNVITIQAELNRQGIQNELFHLPDDKQSLLDKIKVILLEFDVILMSGGVSKGKADYLPKVLDELGVEKKFHRLAQRPGKPFWFGVYEDRIPVFAFPGNPISTIMCFRVYFMEWLEVCLGTQSKPLKAILSKDFSFKPDLGYFLQVSIDHNESGQIVATPQVGNGSGDIANLSQSDGFLYLPKGRTDFPKGELFDYYSFT
ncbi:molybdopterin molybdotransferase MoeA [Reichenbachiella versicolor]|uniref:molybdopterin molybdotransferase MoeA n=1 Tax=Reichenbachiella versicolor TaxID=1821036 RepID=UPI001FE82A13|nr:molybdopterin molybdotransferase MoeA [Reichenbachiella versicolor]